MLEDRPEVGLGLARASAGGDEGRARGVAAEPLERVELVLIGGEPQRDLGKGLNPTAIRRAFDLPERHVDRDPRAFDEVPRLIEEPIHRALEGIAGGVERRVDELAQAFLNMTGEEDRVHIRRRPRISAARNAPKRACSPRSGRIG